MAEGFHFATIDKARVLAAGTGCTAEVVFRVGDRSFASLWAGRKLERLVADVLGGERKATLPKSVPLLAGRRCVVFVSAVPRQKPDSAQEWDIAGAFPAEGFADPGELPAGE